MDTYTKTFFLTIFSLIASSLSQTCEKYTCGGITDPLVCHNRNATVPTAILNNLNKCPSNQYCIFTGSSVPATGDQCAYPNTSRKYYPGSACNTNDDCVFGTCTAGFCAFVADNATCDPTRKDQCKIGSSCRNINALPVCAPVVPNGGACTVTADCDVLDACHNGICTHYYTQPDGTVVDDPLLCDTGFGVITGTKPNTITTCYGTHAPAAPQCTTNNDCIYTYSPTNQTYVFPETENKCVCTYSANPTSVCLPGTADASSIKLINSTVALALAQNVTNCHQAERPTSFCAENSRKPAWSVRKSTRDLTNTKALNDVTLQGADDCAKYVIKDYNDAPVIPDKFVCPKYSCAKQPSCYLGFNPMNEKGDGINVTLWNTCQKNETCSHGIAGNGDTIFDQYVTNGTCVFANTPTSKRFAGEDCDSANTCFVGDCTNGKCPGAALGEKCNTTLDCNAGYYCKSSLCTTQLAEEAVCVSTWDCANNLGCLDGKCTKWGTKAIGSDLGVTTKWNDTLVNNVAFFCELGEAIELDGSYKCSSTNYAGTTAPDIKTGFAACNWGDDCNYQNGNTTYTQKCACGYNAAGQGYCPLASASNVDLYKKAFTKVSNKFNNKCHSQNRFGCYLPLDTKLVSDINEVNHKTLYAHLFYNAVSCASDVLGAGFINVSVALIAVLVAFMF